MIRRAWTWFVMLMDRREPPTVLALVRISVALVILTDLLWIWHLDLVTALWAPTPDGLATGAIGEGAPPLTRWLGGGPEAARALWLVAVIAMACVLFGLGTRAACAISVLVLSEVSRLTPDADRGIDILLRIALGVLALSRANAIWSIDAWFRRLRGHAAVTLVPAWPRYLLFAQMIWLYFSAAQAKVDPAWGLGGKFSALSSIVDDPHFARFAPGWSSTLYPLMQAATIVTMAFEWGAPVFLLATWLDATRERGGALRRILARLHLRWAWLAIGVSFHFGIALMLRLGIFPFGTLALYWVFLRPEEVDSAFRRGRVSQKIATPQR
jgi:hypothetical protein